MDYHIEDAHQPEKAVIGAILAHPSTVFEVITTLAASDFTMPHRLIFEACVQIANDGGLPEIPAVVDHLNLKGLLERAGGWAYLYECEQFEAMQLADMCCRVREHSKRRRLLRLCEESLNGLRAGTPTDECLNQIGEALLDVQANGVESQVFPIKDFALPVVDELYRARRRGCGLVGLSTGIEAIDNATTGIRPGELWIVGGLPGRGKTGFGIQTGITSARNGVPTLIFSLEMSKESVMHRVLAACTGVKAGRIRNPGYLSEDEMCELQEAAARCTEWPLYIDESSQLTTDELRARARLFVRRYGVKLIIVDYLRLIKAPGRELREQVGNASDCLRRIAKEENVAVVGLSQLRRPENINERPTMLALKESGDIEAHAHVCLLLYQPVNDKGEFTHEDEIIIGKQRNGPLGSERVEFDPNTLTFKERISVEASTR